MNFIFHIGTHKTGSTALQSFLFANKDKLLASGILYPTTGLKGNKAHHEVAWTIQSDDIKKTKDLFAKIEKEAESLGVNDILLSSEEFEFIRNANTLKKFFHNQPKVKIILFIRRPDFYLESEYNQHIRMYNTRYKHDIYKFYYHIDFFTRFNYRYLCSIWEPFADLKIINYDKHLKSKLGIFKALLSNIGIEWNDNFVIPDDNESNISLSNIGTIYLARMNKLNLSSSLHQTAIRVITERFKSQPKRHLLPYEDRLVLWSRFKGTNDYVVKHHHVEPFEKPTTIDSDQPAIDFYNDFNEELFYNILNQIKS